MEIVDIYDRERNIIRIGERSEILRQDEYLLAVHNWIVNDNGEILVQKRAACKKCDPNKWAVTGGFARKGETSADTCIRETAEEVGVCLNHSQMRCVISYSLGNIHYDVWISRICCSDSDFVLQETEVSETAWVSSDELDEIDFYNGSGILRGEKILCQKYEYLPLLKAVLKDIE